MTFFFPLNTFQQVSDLTQIYIRSVLHGVLGREKSPLFMDLSFVTTSKNLPLTLVLLKTFDFLIELTR